MRNILFFFFVFFSSFLRSANEISAYKLHEYHDFPIRNIKGIGQDGKGFIYLQSPETTYRFDGYTFREVSPGEAADTLFMKATIRHDANGRMIDNLGNGIEIHDDGELIYHDHVSKETHRLKVFDSYQYQHLINDLKINLITDTRGYVWVSVNGNGVFMYDKETRQLQHFSESDPQPLIDTNYITSMMQDRNGNIWVTGVQNCVTCLKVTSNPYYTRYLHPDPRKQRQKEVRMITRLRDGRLILGDKSGAIFESTDELQTWTQIPTDGDIYISAATDSMGRLWLGSRQGGVLINGMHYGTQRTDCILQDHRGRMWTGGVEGGLQVASLDAQRHYEEQPLLQHIDHLSPRSMIQDSRSLRIYMSSDIGVISFLPDSLLKDSTAYQIELPHKKTICLLQDSAHTLWVGSQSDGIYYKKPNSPTWEHLTTEEGLVSNYIKGLTEAQDGCIGIGTMDGYTHYNPKKGTFRQVHFGNSIDRNFINEGSMVLLHTGEIALGTMEGLVVYNPNDKSPTTAWSPLTITGVEIDGNCLSAEEELQLSHNQNSLAVYFSNLDYGNANQTYYSYYLKGYDRRWSKPSTANIAAYQKLPTGRYTLHVKCRNASGHWDETVEKLSIHIKPPFWATWWAYLTYITIVGGIGLTIVRQMKRASRMKQKIQLEQRITEYRLKFFTNISHEFRTPLTLIHTSMERLTEAGELPISMKLPLSNMQKSVKRMNRLIEQLLEFRRMQNGKLSLAVQETDIVPFLHDIYMSFLDLAYTKEIDYQFVPAEKSIRLCIDRGHVDKVVYNLLSNAFKYTPAKGKIRLTVKQVNERLQIEVMDNGIGIPKERQSTIFDRFETGNIDAGSIGIGLNLAKELMQVHHGEITFCDNPTGGSIFRVLLPMEKSIYAASDFLQADKRLAPDKATSSLVPTSYAELKFEPMNHRRILLVEDDKDISASLSHELSRYLSVECAADGAEAWEKIECNHYDLVISDIRMPVMSGYELLKKIKKSDKHKQMPVVLLTAMCSEDKIEKGLDAGADAYVAKPFSFRVLLSQCYNLIRQRDTLKQVYGSSPAEKTTVTVLIKDEKDKKLLEQIDAMIDVHLGEETFDIAALATLFNQARTSFFNKFKAITGQTPNEYLKEKRLQRAKELLDEGKWTVAEVAIRIGIPNAQYFSTNFKKRYGVTPKAYQKGE